MVGAIIAILAFALAFIFEPLLGWIMVGTVVLTTLIGFLIIMFVPRSSSGRVMSRQEEQERKAAREDAERKFYAFKDALERKYGEADRVFNLNRYGECKTERLLMLFMKVQILCIDGCEVPFSSILGCEIEGDCDIR